MKVEKDYEDFIELLNLGLLTKYRFRVITPK